MKRLLLVGLLLVSWGCREAQEPKPAEPILEIGPKPSPKPPPEPDTKPPEYRAKVSPLPEEVQKKMQGISWRKGCPVPMADLVFIDYQPTTPLSAENLPWHILFGIEASMITSTVCAGRVLMRDRKLLTLDEEAITARSRELAAEVWNRL